MTNKEFHKAYMELKDKFPDFKNSLVIIDTKKELHNATEGDAIELIQALAHIANDDRVMFAVLLTVGEYLRSKLDQDEINGLTKLHLKRMINENIN